MFDVPFPKREQVFHARGGGGGGGALPINGLMGMCRWMGSHFHDTTDYNGAAFSSIFYRVTRMGSHFCGILRVRKIGPQCVRVGA